MKHIEDTHQEMLFTWAKLVRIPNMTGVTAFDLMMHTPNGGKRGVREAARLKKQGVKAGFPDVGLFYANGVFYGLFIEMKRPIIACKPKPKTTPEQMAWLNKLNENGYHAVVCYGFEQAKETIGNYLNGK